MTQQTSPFLEGKYGWNYGESGWNTGMDENLLKFSYLFDRNIDSISTSLPSAVSGTAVYLTTDNRIYYSVNSSWLSTPVPKWFVVTLRSTGQTYTFNGSSLVAVPSNADLSNQITTINGTLSGLGTASTQNIPFFASKSQLDVAIAGANNYTDSQISAIDLNAATNLFKTDLANAIDEAKGASYVGFYGRPLRTRLNEQKSIDDFKIVGQANWNQAFTNAVNYVKGFPGIPPELVCTGEVYEYTVSPNWAVQYLRITGSGATRFRYTGTGNCFIIDGTAYPSMNGVFGMEVKGIIVEGGSSSQNGWYLNSTHHCDFHLRTDGCGTTFAGIDVNFAVCTKFHRPTVSVNHAGAWYGGNKPAIGMRLNQRGVGEQVSYCLIDNPIMEAVGIGISGIAMLGTYIFCGTLEGCTNVGLSLGTGCYRCVVNHTDFEVNVNADIFNSGAENKFMDIDSDSSVVMNTGEYSHMVGGTFKNITVSVGATGTVLDRVVYNRANDGGTLTDNSTTTTITNSRNAFGTYIHNAVPATVGITVTASPFTFTNTKGNSVHVYVVGGTVSQITRKRGTGAAQSTGTTAGQVYLAPGDAISVTYTVAPAMYYMTD